MLRVATALLALATLPGCLFLRWHHPASDCPMLAGWELKIEPAPATGSALAWLPHRAGDECGRVSMATLLSKFRRGTVYRFWLRAVDRVGRRSPWSNGAQRTAG